jgi:TIGR00370 family protein
LRAPFHIFPLGDAAATIELGQQIDKQLNHQVLAMQQWLQQHRFEGLLDSVAGYSSLTVYYDPFIIHKKYAPSGTAFNWVSEQLQQAYRLAAPSAVENNNIIRIPVCYEAPFSPDLASVAEYARLSAAEVVKLHTGNIYNIYMIGFLPGFSYMGPVNPQIAVPRKARPVPVAAGSVGIAGSQTGIYPLNSPGGWQVIGRTPLKIFDPFADEPVLLRAGNKVQFYPITIKEFGEWQSQSSNPVY